MQALLLASISASCLGGSLTLGALFYHFFAAPQRSNARVASSTLEKRHHKLLEDLQRAREALDAKQATLEELAARASNAAKALDAALHSLNSSTKQPASYASYEFGALEDPRANNAKSRRRARS